MNPTWPIVPLRDACELVVDGTHHSPPNGPTGDYRYITAKNIRPWGLDISDVTYVDRKTHDEIYSRCPVSKGDVLYIKDGATTGIAVINDLAEPFSLLSSVALLKPRRDFLDASYLKHWLNSPETFALMTGSMTGTAIKRLVLRQIREAEIPLPSMNVQRKIALKLDSLLARAQSLRTRLMKVPTVLKRFREAVLEAAVSGTLTEEWRNNNGVRNTETTINLSDAALAISYGSSAKSQKTGDVPVLRMGNIQNGRLDWADLVYTSDPEEIAKYELSDGDVLFNRTNSPELVGKTAVFHGNRPAVYAGYLIRIKCGPTMNPDYLGYCLNSPSGRRHSWSVKSDGVSQSNINASKLGDYKIPMRSMDEQREIARRVEELLGLAHSLGRQLDSGISRVKQLTPSILNKAFRGALVPQGPADEPASGLLERIRAESSVKPSHGGRTRLKGIGTRKTKRGGRVPMGKSRSDADVKGKPYLAKILRENGGRADAAALFRQADLPVADFYKQLAWEVDAGHIKDKKTTLEVA